MWLGLKLTGVLTAIDFWRGRTTWRLSRLSFSKRRTTVSHKKYTTIWRRFARKYYDYYSTTINEPLFTIRYIGLSKASRLTTLRLFHDYFIGETTTIGYDYSRSCYDYFSRNATTIADPSAGAPGLYCWHAVSTCQRSAEGRSWPRRVGMACDVLRRLAWIPITGTRPYIPYYNRTAMLTCTASGVAVVSGIWYVLEALWYAPTLHGRYYSRFCRSGIVVGWAGIITGKAPVKLCALFWGVGGITCMDDIKASVNACI